MESKVHILNRKKMKRFLQSLRVRTTEELEERKRLLENLDMVDNRFKSVRDQVTATIFRRTEYEPRHEMLSAQSTHRSASVSDNGRAMKPRFRPASRFPLPMKPPPFLPSKGSKNAKRVMNVGRLRETPAIHSEIDPALIAPDVTLPRLAIAQYELE
jgi:hypothetical protein